MKITTKKGFTGIEIAIVIAVLALLGGVYYVNQHNKTVAPTTTDTTVDVTTTPPPAEPTTTTTTTTQATTPKDETADWKTYTNTQYQFSLKYPKDFYTHTENPSGVKNFIADITNYQYKGEINKGTEVSKIPELAKLDRLVMFHLDKNGKQWQTELEKYLINKEVKNIGGLDVTTASYRNPEDPNGTSPHNIVAYWDSGTASIALSNLGDEGNHPLDIEMLKKIISTLKSTK